MKKNILMTIVLLSLAACTGDISLFGDGNTEFGTQPALTKEVDSTGKIPRGENNGEVPTEDVCRFINPGKTPLRRLTKLEYNNSVQDLFPTLAIPLQDLAEDERVGIFSANTTSAVDLVIAEKYMGAAESIAEIAITDETFCAASCDLQWALNLAEKAFRRPLNPDESAGIKALFETTETKFSNEVAVRMTVEAILQSSAFLYRAELGEDPSAEVTKLTPFELASRLSYFLAGTIPDGELINAAKDGKLADSAAIEAQARRILESAKGRDRVNAALSTWLGVEHIEDVERDGLTPSQQTALLMESQTFIDSVMWDGNATLDELLTADYAFVSKENEDLYGVTVNGEFERVQLPAERRGILGHPSFLASHGGGQAIVHRGKFIKDAFLCLNTPDPPSPLIPLPTFEEESDRSKADKRIAATEEGCATCHAVVDGIGKVFDPFDETGRFRTQDAFGNPVTSAGSILGTDIDGEINGMGELAAAMASSKNVRSCVTKQFLSYSLGRITSHSDDACTLLGMQQALELSNGNLKEMLVAVVKTDAFRYRRRLDVGGDQ